MPANRHLGRSASQVAFRKARAEMAELYNKGYSPDQIITEVLAVLARWMPGVEGRVVKDLGWAILVTSPRPGVPNINDIRATRDFAVCDMGDV
jgi:hypothetical protein